MNEFFELTEKLFENPLTIGLGVILLLMIYILSKICLEIAKKFFKGLTEIQQIWLAIIIIAIFIIAAFTIFALYLIYCNS